MNKTAFLFDLNGTMIDDMGFHNQAWFDILNQQLDAGMSWEEVKAQMYGKNEELLERVFGSGAFTAQQMLDISLEKERAYQQAYLPHLALITGLQPLLEKAYSEGISMGIGSAAIPFNIDFVLDNLHIRKFFKAIVSAHDVEWSKPDPETFLKLARLMDTEPRHCIVFEDAPKGVEAAANAGMKSIVLTTTHKPEEFGEYDNILYFIQDYSDPALQSLFH